MKLALILNAIVPTIGGVLIRGEKGTGKSTAVRGLARLLPEHDVVEGCHFGCDPTEREALCADCRMRLQAAGMLPHHKRRMRVVELPINASEDRVVGTIDIEAALRTGQKRFERGVHEFTNEFAAADSNLSRALAEAIGRVRDVRLTAGHARLISSICVEAEVLGHRADVVIDHAARALAAYRRHGSPSREDIYDAATPALAHRARQPLRRIDLPRQRRVRKQGGKRAASQTPDRRGRYVRAEPKEKVSDLAIDATVRAAAPLQRERGRRHGERLMLERQDLRQKVRERKVGNLIVFVVDASASMD